MGTERGQVRNIVDLTGVILKPKDPKRTALPRIYTGIDRHFYNQVVEAIGETFGMGYEAFAQNLFGKGNPVLKAFYDQELRWKVLRESDLNELLHQDENLIEKAARWGGKYIRNYKHMPKWMSAGVTVIELDEFDVDSDKVDALSLAAKNGEKNTYVSGNSFWSRRPLVRKLGKAAVKTADPELGMILPPYYKVKPVRLKTGSAIWCSQGANQERVRAHEDDFPMALFMSIWCEEVTMPVDEKTAKNQPHTDNIIKQSGLANLIREDRVKFAKAT